MYLADNGLPYFCLCGILRSAAGIEPHHAATPTSRWKRKLYETGVKYAPSFLDGYINLALFDLEQTNSLVSTGSGQQTQAGEVTSRGRGWKGACRPPRRCA